MTEKFIRATFDMDTSLIPVSSIKLVYYTLEFENSDNLFLIKVGVGEPSPDSELLYKDSLIVKSFRGTQHEACDTVRDVEEYMKKFMKMLNTEGQTEVE